MCPRRRRSSVVVAVGTVLAPGAASAAAPAEQLYVSVGGSYASGYQPGRPERGREHPQRVRLPGPRPGGEPWLPAQARELRRRGRHHDLADLHRRLPAASARPRRSCVPGPDPARGRRALPAQQPPKHRSRHGVDRGQRHHRMRARPDPVGCVVSGVAVIEKNVSLIAKRLRRRRRAPRPDRRHHLSRRDPRTVGERRPGIPRPGLAVGVRLSDAHQPRSEEGLRHGGRSLRRRVAASGAYTPFEQVTTLQPYGTVPGRGACLRAQLLLRAGRHPRPDRRLCADSAARGGSAAATVGRPALRKLCLQVGRRYRPSAHWASVDLWRSGR